MATGNDALGLRRQFAPTFYDQADYAQQVADVEQQAKIQAEQEFNALSEPGKAARQGVLGLRSTVTAAQAIPDLIVGDEEEAAEDLGEAAELGLRAERYRPAVSRIEDVNSPEDAAQLLVNTVAAQAPNLALAVAGGGVGALAARMGLRGAVGAATEQAAARALPLATRLAPETAKEAAARAGLIAGERLATQRLTSGAAKGAVAAVYPTLAGENLLALNEEGGGADRGNAVLAAAGAVPQTLLETALPMRVLKNLGLTRQFERAARQSVPKGMLQRITAETGKGALVEGSTELAQQALQLGLRKVVNNNLDVLDDANLSELLNSFVLGAIGGGTFAGGSKALGEVGERLFEKRGAVSDRLDQLEAEQEGDTGFRESRGDALDADTVLSLFDKILVDGSPLRGNREVAELLANESNARRDPDGMKQLILESIATQVRPELKIKPEGLAGYFDQQQILDPDEAVEVDEEAEPVETSFEDSSDPRAVSTIEPGARRYYGDERLTEDEQGNKSYVPTKLHEQLFQTAKISNELQEAKGSAQRYATSSVDTNLEKLAVEQARREGKDDVGEIAARIERVSGAERARAEAKATGRRVSEVAAEAAAALVEGKPELAQLLATKYQGDALKFLEGFESLSVEESPIDKPPGYTPKRLATLLGQAPTKVKPLRAEDGQIAVKYRGKERQLDIKALVFEKQHDKDLTRDTENRSVQFEQRVADVVGDALSELASTPGIEIDFKSIDPKTVVYRRKGGITYTWGQVAPLITKGKRKGKRGGLTGFVPETLNEGPLETDDVPSEEVQEQGASPIDRGEPIRERIEPKKSPVEKGAKTTVEPLLSQQTEQPEAATDRSESAKSHIQRGIRLIEKRLKKAVKLDNETVGQFKARVKAEQGRLEVMKQQLAAYEVIDEDLDAGRVKQAGARELLELLRRAADGEVAPGVREIRPPAKKAAATKPARKERAAKPVDRERMTKLTGELAKRLAIGEIQLVDTQGALAVLNRLLELAKDPNVKAEIRATIERVTNGETQGLSFSPEKGVSIRTVFVNEKMGLEKQLEVLSHELGHQVFASNKVSKETFSEIRDAWAKWRHEHGLDPQPLLLRGKQSAVSLMRMVNNPLHHDVNRPHEQGLEWKDRAYHLEFEEFFADHVARWLTSRAEPQSLMDKYFAGIAKKLQAIVDAVRKAFGAQTDVAGAVSDLMDAIFDKTDLVKQAELEVRAQANEDGKSLLEHSRDAGMTALRISAHMAPTSPQANVAVHQALIDELTSSELRILGRTFGSGPIRRRLLELVPRGVRTAIQRDVAGTTNLVISYGYQLWKAGQLQVGPQTTTVFDGVAEMFADSYTRALGTVKDVDKAQEILIGMQQGILKSQKTAGGVLDVERNRGKGWNDHARKTVQGTIDVANKLLTPVTTVMTRLYDSKIPTLIALGNRFAFRVGEQGQAENFIEAKNRRTTEFGKKFVDAMKGLTEDQKKEVGRLLNATQVARTKDKAVNAAVRQIRAVLKELRDYAVHPDRGGASFMGEIKDYFPWVFDMEALQKRRAEFEALVGQSKFEADLKKLKMTPAELYDYVIDQYGAADVELVKGPVPYARNINSRWLKFLHDKGDAKDRKALGSFLSTDIDTTLAVYTSQVVKRAEFAAILGKKGEKLEAILAQAKKEGASDKQLAAAEKFVQAMMGSYGAAEFHPIIQDALKLGDRWFGTKWAETNPKDLRKLQGLMIVYQNLRVLGFAVLSTLPDSAGLLLRGDLDSAFEGLRTGIREAVNLAKGNKSAIIELGETIGTIESHAIQELLQQAYGSTYMPVFARKLNDKWFQAIGVTYYTKLARLMALAAGKRFIANQVNKPGPHVERFLSELNLEKGDIKFDKAGDLVVDDKIAAALNRYVDQTIVRPNASQRPLWSSHPDFAILFHLKQFMFSMEEVILRRMAHEVANGNVSPVVTALAGYISIGIMSDLVREELKFDEEDPRKRDWTVAAYVKSGAQRAGLFGTGELLLKLQQERLYGGSGVKALAGPSYSQASELMDALVFGGRDEWKTALEAVPAANLLLEERIFGRDQEDDDGEEESQQEAA